VGAERRDVAHVPAQIAPERQRAPVGERDAVVRRGNGAPWFCRSLMGRTTRWPKTHPRVDSTRRRCADPWPGASSKGAWRHKMERARRALSRSCARRP
jgi:hypothetical protein